jgi:hypothetical protein
MMIDLEEFDPEMTASGFFEISKEITARRRQECDPINCLGHLLDTGLRHVVRSINGNSPWLRGNFVTAVCLKHPVNCP